MTRIATAGSVDDGKSTLIGRLLVDSKTLFDDHSSKISELGRKRGMAGSDLAAVTDGLKAEREQGITIDVAYRYFALPGKRFVLIDTPGHEQYTRNMVTGASNAQTSIVLVDASSGLKPQTYRHCLIAALLGHPHLIFAVNKMDLVDFNQARFAEIKTSCDALAKRLGIVSHQVIPISALGGEGVVHPSPRLDWYIGPTLFAALEALPEDDILPPAQPQLTRMAVRWINRLQDADGGVRRGLTGVLSGERLAVGDAVSIAPEGWSSKVARLWRSGRQVDEVHQGEDVQLQLADQIDAYPGQVICHGEPPRVSKKFDLNLCWFDTNPGSSGQVVLAQHAGQRVKAKIGQVHYVLHPESLSRQTPGNAIELNQIVRLSLQTASPLPIDPYEACQQTGSLILIDQHSNATLAAGVLSREFD